MIASQNTTECEAVWFPNYHLLIVVSNDWQRNYYLL